MKSGKTIFTIIALPVLFLFWLSLIVSIPYEGMALFTSLGKVMRESHPAIGVPAILACTIIGYTLLILSFASIIRLSFWLGGRQNYKALREFEIAMSH